MYKILIVDDIIDNIEVLELLLEDYCFEKEINTIEIDSEIDGLKVMEKIEKGNYDIVFLDIMMPKIHGIKLLENIRNNLSIKQPIVVMATALNNKATRIKEKNLGANAFMVKPLRYEMIEVMMEKYMSILDNNSFDTKEIFEFEFEFDEEDETNYEEMNELEQILHNLNMKELISAQDLFQKNNVDETITYNHVESLNQLFYSLFKEFYVDGSSSLDELELNLENDFESVKEIINEFQILIEDYEEFSDMNIILQDISDSFFALNITNLSGDDKEYLEIIIKSILNDIVHFTDIVFVEKSANNIFYIDGSLASSGLELRRILNL